MLTKCLQNAYNSKLVKEKTTIIQRLLTRHFVLIVMMSCSIGLKSFSQCDDLPGWEVNHETCYNANDGKICCNTSGVIVPVICVITPPAGSYDPGQHCFSGLPPGTYDIDITYNNGCIVSILEMIINENTTSPVIFNPNITNSCNNPNGQVCVNPTGGFGNYSYAWETSASFLFPYLSTTNCTGAISPGTYYLRLRDYNPISDNNCEIQVNYTVVDYTPVLSATVNATTVCDCPGGNGNIDLSVSGGDNTYSYVWSGPNGFVASSQDINSLCEGTYTVVVTSAGCSSTQSYTVSGEVIDFTGDLYITTSSDLLWTSADYFGSEFIIDGNVYVQTGANLVISGVDVRLTGGKMIRVNNGASLTATNNSTFDVSCDPTWRGFRVYGVGANPSTSQQSQRGKLELHEGTEVHHAECAISNYQLTISGIGAQGYASGACSTSGGQISCEGVLFMDNVRDVSLARYVPQIGDPTPPYTTYLATFNKCDFLLDLFPTGRESTQLNPQSPRILLNQVAEVFFFDCKGIMTATNQYSAGINRSIFLQSFKSYFDWYGCPLQADYNLNACEAEVTGFTNSFAIQDHFTTNFNFGAINCGPISASNINNIIHISGTDFECVQAINASKVENIRVLNNNIRDLDAAHNSTPNSNRVCVTIVGDYGTTTRLRVAGNSFLSLIDIESLYKISPALNINNGGPESNFVIDNTFTHYNTAVSFKNENRADANGGNTDQGLHYECNTFEDCKRDISIDFDAGVLNPNRRGVASLQSKFWNPQNLLRSAGNDFNLSVFNGPGAFGYAPDDAQLNTNLTAPAHEYLYHPQEFNDANQSGPDPLGVPTEMSGATQTLTDVANIGGSFNPCDYNYNISDFTGINFTQALNNARMAYLEYDLLQQAIKDGGATENLNNLLDEAGFSDAINVYNDLIAASPNLSEAILLKAIQLESVLPNSLLAIVLASNPQSTKFPSVMAALEARINALDSYQMLLIENGRLNPISPLELMDRMKANVRFEEVRLRTDYEEKLAMDESDTFENTCSNYYYPEEFYEDLVALADIHYRHGNSLDGDDLLLSAPSSFKMSDAAINHLEETVYLHNLENNILTLQGGELTAAQFEYLESLWFTDPFGSGLIAVNMLVYLADYEPEWPESDEHPEEKILRVTNKTKTPFAILSPNPAKELTVIKFLKPCLGNESLTVYDLQGQIMQHVTIRPGQKEISLILDQLPSGNYLVHCIDASGNVLMTHPLVKL